MSFSKTFHLKKLCLLVGFSQLIIGGGDNRCLSDAADDEEGDLIADEAAVLEHDYNNYHSDDLNIAKKTLNDHVSGADAVVDVVANNNARKSMPA